MANGRRAVKGGGPYNRPGVYAALLSSCKYRSSASSQAGRRANPAAVRLALLILEFSGLIALDAVYSAVVTGSTSTCFPAARKIAAANSAQEHTPSFVA